MAWCEANGVDYLFGLARNPRLVAALEAEQAAARAEAEAKGRPARRYKDFLWSTRDSWSCQRRVVGKADVDRRQGQSPLRGDLAEAPEARSRRLYETLYCPAARCRIKECQLDLFADRTSARTMRANQLRLWFASWPMCCSAPCVGSIWPIPASPEPAAASAQAAEDRRPGAHQRAPSSRWPRAVLTRASSRPPTPDYPPPQRKRQPNPSAEAQHQTVHPPKRGR